jgi:hypothetical protein
VLIIIFILIIIAVFAYERRVHGAPVKSVFATQLQPSPTAVQTVGDQ